MITPKALTNSRIGQGSRGARKAVCAKSFLGEAPKSVGNVVDSIREAVAHSSCAPYFDLATESTLIINPPWSEEVRATGISHAECGVTTSTHYIEEHVRPIASAFETDGSVFLLWERRADYTSNADGTPHLEDICGVTYVKLDAERSASVIGTFRQPSAEEMRETFKPDHGIVIRPGSDNFFDGKLSLVASPVCDMQMVASIREFYSAFSDAAKVESTLGRIADSRFRVKEPMWEVAGSYLPVNRVEVQLWMERMIKNAGGKLKFEPKTIVPCEGTNLVFCLWFAEGLDVEPISGVHLFFFGDDLKIKSLASFREPTGQERKSFLKAAAKR